MGHQSAYVLRLLCLRGEVLCSGRRVVLRMLVRTDSEQ